MNSPTSSRRQRRGAVHAGATLRRLPAELVPPAALYPMKQIQSPLTVETDADYFAKLWVNTKSLFDASV